MFSHSTGIHCAPSRSYSPGFRERALSYLGEPDTHQGSAGLWWQSYAQDAMGAGRDPACREEREGGGTGSSHSWASAAHAVPWGSSAGSFASLEGRARLGREGDGHAGACALFSIPTLKSNRQFPMNTARLSWGFFGRHPWLCRQDGARQFLAPPPSTPRPLRATHGQLLRHLMKLSVFLFRVLKKQQVWT